MATRLPDRVSGRIPSLDGLRAVAILMVGISHLEGARFDFASRGSGHFPTRVTLGNLGVRIFFVISGLLITTLLLEEMERKGQISLKQFYLRRAFRILPAGYAFLGILALSAFVGGPAIPGNSCSPRSYTYEITGAAVTGLQDTCGLFQWRSSST